MDLATPDGPHFRTYEYSYDELDQLRSSKITTTEYTTSGSITREFTYTPNLASGTFTRYGPDGMDTVVQLDLAGRVQSVNRGGGFITANYSYLDNGLVERIDFGNGTATVYTYDVANRVTTIAHVNPAGQSALLMAYTYNNRGLPTMIVETGVLGGPVATVTFVYDDRGRLITERRVGNNAYDLAYAYDVGGNRRTKTDALALTQVIYAYDIDQTAIYGTANNRLMTADTTDISACDPLVSSCPIISTDFYYYTFAGNVERVVTELANPAAGEPRFSAVRYQYAANAQIATYVVGETWDADGPDTGICPDNYTVTFAREYRYDSSRARYLDRMLDEQQAKLGNVVAVLSTWTDYDGSNTYSDFFSDGSTITNGNKYELGIARVKVIPGVSSDTFYAHGDHLGTLRAESDVWAAFNTYPVHTAFGEDMTGLGQRHSYVGAFGYQSNPNFTALHVGARYYDPASGRFLQRDPIGILGGLNVYAYVGANPLLYIDPAGLQAATPWPIPTPGTPIPPPGSFMATPFPRLGGYAVLCYTAWKIGDQIGNYLNRKFNLPNTIAPYLTPIFTQSSSSSGGLSSLIIGCFAAGTLVVTGEGGTPIERLEGGDFVISSDVVSMANKVVTVSRTMSFLVRQVIELTVDDELIVTTANHPFWVVGRGWVEASMLNHHDLLLNIAGESVTIQDVAVKQLSHPVRVYNLTVIDTNTYYIGNAGLLVHNKNV